MNAKDILKLAEQAAYDDKPLVITPEQKKEWIKVFDQEGYSYFPDLRFVWGVEVIVREVVSGES